MTPSGGKPHKTGDQGQRYEVTYLSQNLKTRQKFGWANTPEGALAMCDSIRMHPGMSHPEIRDREVEKDPAFRKPVAAAPGQRKRSYEDEE
jgi:hypothetical protein